MNRFQSERLARALAAKSEDQTRPVPAGMEWLWDCFVQLSNARSYGAAGPHAISFQEVEAFARLTGTTFEPWHVKALMAADLAWRRQLTQKAPALELTPGMIDAAF